jgi:hypothetical protein
MRIDSGYALLWDDSHERIEQSDGHLEFFINNGQAMTLNTNGLGIGTTSPTGKLNVEAPGNHLHLRAGTAAAGKYWNFDITANNQLFIITDGGNRDEYY